MTTVYYITNPKTDLSGLAYKLLGYGLEEMFGITDGIIQRQPMIDMQVHHMVPILSQ